MIPWYKYDEMSYEHNCLRQVTERVHRPWQPWQNNPPLLWILKFIKFKIAYSVSEPDMIFLGQTFFGGNILHKKCVNRDNGKFTTNQRKCFKMQNFWQKAKLLQNYIHGTHIDEEGSVIFVGSCNKVSPEGHMSSQ